ncbi:MAG: MFS transporter [Bryobacterales bacterium]|nr:MFS transporter [Bryobacterales bacterium]
MATAPSNNLPGGRYSVREQRSWYVYDWANSAYASTVLTLFLGPYLTSVSKAAADSNGLVYPLGIPVDHRAYWGYLISLAVFIQIFVLPMVGAVADYSARKKQLLGVFAYVGAGATMAMFFVAGGRYLLGGALFLLSNTAFGASIVLYNAFLPEIAPEDQRDSVSSKGWGIGYLGGGLLLVLNLLLFQNAAKIGLSEAMAVRLSLASAGLWWAVFALVPMLELRNRTPVRKAEKGEPVLAKGFLQLLHTLKEMRRYPQTLTFLVAYMIYNDAIQAVISLAGQFGSDELKIPMSTLTMAILMVQFVAFGGALLFNLIAKALGTKRTVMMSLVMWTMVMVGMYAVHSTAHFFVAAGLVGAIMGGSQALSRSLFSLMIPKGREAEYFSLYEISDKGTSWMAPLIYGLTVQWTGSYRTAILSLIVFFAGGLLVLAKVDVRRATIEAGNEPV